VDLVGPVALELVVGELELDGSIPAAQAAEDLVSLRGRVVVLDLDLYLRGLSFLSLLGCIGSLLFLLVFLFLFLLLVALVFSIVLALLVRRVGLFLFPLLGLLGRQL
jgi:VIT1/CCC1 family predicted Fe2+/Mn2+ transporter